MTLKVDRKLFRPRRAAIPSTGNDDGSLPRDGDDVSSAAAAIRRSDGGIRPRCRLCAVPHRGHFTCLQIAEVRDAVRLPDAC
jgi:hypothetical protein